MRNHASRLHIVDGNQITDKVRRKTVDAVGAGEKGETANPDKISPTAEKTAGRRKGRPMKVQTLVAAMKNPAKNRPHKHRSPSLRDNGHAEIAEENDLPIASLKTRQRVRTIIRRRDSLPTIHRKSAVTGGSPSKRVKLAMNLAIENLNNRVKSGPAMNT